MANKKSFFPVCIALITIILHLIPNVEACLRGSEDYASEVVLNNPEIDYNLNSMLNAKNVIFREGSYRFLSHYNENLLVILSEVSDKDIENGGLSVRIQIPTKTEKEEVRYIKLVSSSATGKINESRLLRESNYSGWNIECYSGIEVLECDFAKSQINLRAFKDSGEYKVEIEITGDLEDCNKGCDGGYCLRSGGQSTCIDSKKIIDIEGVLSYAGIIKSFYELVEKQSIIKNGFIPILTTSQDLQGEAKYDEIIWEAAMRKELTWLKTEGIIRITNSDINDISRLANEGTAGINKRIVYTKDSEGVKRWIYYKDSLNPVANEEKECSEISVSQGITGMVIFEPSKLSLYYLIPSIVTATFLTLIFLAVIIVRLRYQRIQKKKDDNEKRDKEIKEAKIIDEDRKKKKLNENRFTPHRYKYKTKESEESRKEN